MTFRPAIYMRPVFLPTLLLMLLFSLSLAGAAEKEPLAEGKYSYLKPDKNNTILASRWAEFAQAMPDWKHKAKKAHYRFKDGVVGRKCDSKDCHPGFKDPFVAELLALPEGETRNKAKAARHGVNRCEDCHAYQKIVETTNACRLHFQLKDRVQCNSCHTEGAEIKALIPVGDKKTIALRDHDERMDWPGHQITKDEKKVACDKNCHTEQNPFTVVSVCGNCHGKDKLELESYVSDNLLVHQTVKDNPIPDYLRLFYKILITSFAIFAGLFIILDVIRARKEDSK